MNDGKEVGAGTDQRNEPPGSREHDDDLHDYNGDSDMNRWDEYPLLDSCDGKQRREMRQFLNEHHYEPGGVILQQGERGSRFHIIVAGETEVVMQREIEVVVARLERGQFIGEMSCLTGELISATVRAASNVHTVSISREGLLRLMDMNGEFRRHMMEAMVKRIQTSNSRLVDEHTRSRVVSEQLAAERASHLGHYVGDSAFMGQLRERMDKLAHDDHPLWITGETGTGKYHAAYEIHHRSARAEHPFIMVDGTNFRIDDWQIRHRAARGGTIVIREAHRIPEEELANLLRSDQTVENGDGFVNTRLIFTGETVPETIRIQTLSLLPLRKRTEDIPELVYEFLNREGVAEPQKAITPEALRLLAAFPYLRGNIEELGGVVRQAFARSEGRVIAGSHLKFGSRRKPGERPRIGLALGSGSVRGAAHVGVLKVLEENGIPIDYIAGTSVGAFIGALYAGGQPIENFERVLPNVRWRQLVNWVLPPKAFADNQPMIRFVEKFIGPVEFHELSIPFAAVASDAISGDAFILNKGKVSEAVCASTAIPGVMKPVRYDGRLLIDGAVVHPVPVALCRSMGADVVIAVDVGIPSKQRRTPNNIIASILNTIDIMSDKIVQEELQLADVVLRPQLDIQEFTFKQSAAYIRCGVETTCDSLTQIRAAIEHAANT